MNRNVWRHVSRNHWTKSNELKQISRRFILKPKKATIGLGLTAVGLGIYCLGPNFVAFCKQLPQNVDDAKKIFDDALDEEEEVEDKSQVHKTNSEVSAWTYLFQFIKPDLVWLLVSISVGHKFD